MHTLTALLLLPFALALPASNTLLSNRAAQCSGHTFAHIYGYEDGCWTGFQKFSYELSESGCWSRVANTDNRVHYITSDLSGDCHRIGLWYYKGREATGDFVKKTMAHGECVNINTGWAVESIKMECLGA
ncbi:hypothetical protein VHEMI01414 [[Torrubiella] hemipterigena]|uniref:Uncharacterized protein n=1 Tax=[Torrubiella] hemipterigena TaxID=1531966 RepID=A0A0A1ST12_9HYPO|nr:hypothetical protein VHEMI01414 [[Torrubiella] hemipterigena]